MLNARQLNTIAIAALTMTNMFVSFVRWRVFIFFINLRYARSVSDLVSGQMYGLTYSEIKAHISFICYKIDIHVRLHERLKRGKLINPYDLK